VQGLDGCIGATPWCEMGIGATTEYEPRVAFSGGKEGLAQGRGLNGGEPDPDFDGSELSYESSGAPSMVKSGYDKMLNRVVVSTPSTSGFPIGEGCE